MTKGDRIRQSDDKELATIITNMMLGFTTNVIQVILGSIDPSEIQRTVLKDLHEEDPEAKPKIILG